MKYIKDCPDCGKKIRFPLDKGRIRVFCSCGYTTIIDPDDTTLYVDGNFDLMPDKKTSGTIVGLVPSFFKKLTWKNFINSLLEIKYKIQNIRYLPNRERNWLLAVIILVMLAISVAVYYL